MWQLARQPLLNDVTAGHPGRGTTLGAKYGNVLRTLISQQNDQTLQGSFSAVSAPIVASKYACFRSFRDLQDAHTFAPFEVENLSKNSSNFLAFSYFFQESVFFIHFHRILL